MLNSNFSTKFLFFWIFLDFLALVNIHVIKIITWIELLQMNGTLFFPLILLIFCCVGIGIGYKSIVIVRFCAQPMHQIFVIKYYISSTSFRVWKKSLPIKILCSFVLTAQPQGNIANRRGQESLFPYTPSSILLAYYGHGMSNMVYIPQIFHSHD